MMVMMFFGAFLLPFLVPTFHDRMKVVMKGGQLLRDLFVAGSIIDRLRKLPTTIVELRKQLFHFFVVNFLRKWCLCPCCCGSRELPGMFSDRFEVVRVF